MKNPMRYFQLAASLPAFTDYDSFNRKDWPEFLLDRGRYAEVLAAANAPAEKPSPLAGDAELATDRPQEAATELASADQLERALRPGDSASLRLYTDGLRAAL